MKILLNILMVVLIVISVLIIYVFWTAYDRDELKGPTSITGIKTTICITDIHRMCADYETEIILTDTNWSVFVYNAGSQDSRDDVQQLIDSMKWVKGNTLSFTTKKEKTVTISYSNGLWNLIETRQSK